MIEQVEHVEAGVAHSFHLGLYVAVELHGIEGEEVADIGAGHPTADRAQQRPFTPASGCRRRLPGGSQARPPGERTAADCFRKPRRPHSSTDSTYLVSFPALCPAPPMGSQRPLELIDYATTAQLTTCFGKAAVTMEDNAAGGNAIAVWWKRVRR